MPEIITYIIYMHMPSTHIDNTQHHIAKPLAALHSTHLRRPRRRRLDRHGGVEVGQPRVGDDGRRGTRHDGPLGVVGRLRDRSAESLSRRHDVDVWRVLTG